MHPGNGDRVIVNAIEPAVPLCETDCSKCGSYLLSNAACPRRRDRGCLLLKNPKYQLVGGRQP